MNKEPDAIDRGIDKLDGWFEFDRSKMRQLFEREVAKGAEPDAVAKGLINELERQEALEARADLKPDRMESNMSDPAVVSWAASDAQQHAQAEQYWQAKLQAATTPQQRLEAVAHVRQEEAAIRQDAVTMTQGLTL